MILRRDKTDRVADRVGAARASDAMHVILRVHRKVVIHDVRNPVHIDPARSDIGRHQHPHRARLEVFQSAQSLILRAVGMDRPRLDSAALEPPSHPISTVLCPGKNKDCVKLLDRPGDVAEEPA